MTTKEQLASLFKHYFLGLNNASNINSATADIDLMVEYIEDIAEQAIRNVLAKGVGTELSDKELKSKVHFMLIREAAKLANVADDAGCDWFTDNEGNTYIGGPDWRVSTDPLVARLVEVAYYVVGNDARLPNNKNQETTTT